MNSCACMWPGFSKSSAYACGYSHICSPSEENTQKPFVMLWRSIWLNENRVYKIRLSSWSMTINSYMLPRTRVRVLQLCCIWKHFQNYVGGMTCLRQTQKERSRRRGLPVFGHANLLALQEWSSCLRASWLPWLSPVCFKMSWTDVLKNFRASSTS